jgi:hypothetical protein
MFRPHRIAASNADLNSVPNLWRINAFSRATGIRGFHHKSVSPRFFHFAKPPHGRDVAHQWRAVEQLIEQRK